MALPLLPEEVLEVIVDYLSAKDIISCSAVCIGWREKFNNDLFWRKFCIRQIKSYLETNQCEVEPSFNLPDQNEEGLQTVCTWRIHYMRKTHLLNNWKSAKFTSSIIRPFSEVVSCDVRYDCEGCHWLFIKTIYNVEIWNINTTPQLYAVIPVFSESPKMTSFIIGKRAILSQWNVSTVYDLDCRNEPLKSISRFALEENKALSRPFWDSVNKREIEQINETDEFRYHTFGNLFVGHKRIPKSKTDLSMHIWDISSGEKLKCESMINKFVEFDAIVFSNIFKIDQFKGLIRIVFISIDKDLYSQLVIYDFKRCKFGDLNIKFEGVAAWCGCAHDICVTFTSHPGILQFYKCSSGKLLSVKHIDIYTNSEQMQLIDSYLLYCTFNSMKVLDIHKQEVVHCLEFSFSSFVTQLTVIEPRFVVVWLMERGISPGCPSYYQEVWDMKNRSKKLFQCSSDLGIEMVTSSSSMIKQIINCCGLIHLYNFW